eukprot:2009752-Lingulodinium_polyedra.AAC.1
MREAFLCAIGALATDCLPEKNGLHSDIQQWYEQKYLKYLECGERLRKHHMENLGCEQHDNAF